MLKRDYTAKRGQLMMLLTLLAAVIGVMIFIGKSSHSKYNPFSSAFVPAGGDTLNIAIELNPSVYMVKGDSASGRDYEMLCSISERYGVPMKFYPFVPLKRAMDGLDRGEFQLVVASLPLTTDLRERYLMSEPVYLDREILVQRADSSHTPIKSQVELGGDTVWIASDSPFRSRLENLSAEIGDTIYVRSSPEYSAEALFILTATGHINYAVINEGIARELIGEYPQVDISTPISFTQFQSWAMQKADTALCDSINRWIAAVKAAQVPNKTEKKARRR